MRTFLISVGLVGGLLAGQVTPAAAQEARYFRIAGPVPTTIADVTADGNITLISLAINTTFTVQTSPDLAGASNWVDWVQVPVSNWVTVWRIFDLNPPAGMALIPAGSFTMGNCMDTNEGYSDELPLHTVYVSAFYMDKYEVTKAMWDDVYNWATNHGYSFEYGAQGKASNHPEQSMTWYNSVKWCNARSEKEGRVPAYYTDAAQTVVYRSGQTNVDNAWVNWSSGYRLPTEAEWEKAARGGASGHRFPWSNVDTITHSQANYVSFGSGNPSYDVSPTSGYHPSFQTGGYPYTSPVGYFGANGYGLYDMAGNVWEWCWDWYGVYSSSSQTDPRGPTSGPYRGLRGGSWDDHVRNARCARRVNSPGLRTYTLGFRCALPPGQ